MRIMGTKRSLNGVMVLSLGIVLLFPGFVCAETIVLKSGKKIRGKIIETTERFMKVDTDVGTPQVFSFDEIYSVDDKPITVRSTPLAEEQLVNPDKTFEDFQYLSYQYLALGDFEKAVRYAQEALTLKSDSTIIYYNLGVAYFLQRDYSQTIANFDRLVKLSKDKVKDFLKTDLKDFDNPEELSAQNLEKIGNFMILINSYPMLMKLYMATSNLGKTHSLIDEYEDLLRKIDAKIKDSTAELLVGMQSEIGTYLAEMARMKKTIRETDSSALLESIEKDLTENKSQILQQLLATQIQSNETSVIGILEMAVAACQAYRADLGRYPQNLSVLCRDKNLNGQLFLDEKRLDVSTGNPKINGYELEYTLIDDLNFKLSASPILEGKTGERFFRTDQNGQISVYTEATGLASPGAPENQTQ